MKPPPTHQCRVITLPASGLSCVFTDSGRHFPRHAHGGHGLGLLDRGAQASASGRGTVQAYEGEVISNNPGEVHDGRPIGAPSRRWRIVHLPAGWLEASLDAEAAALHGSHGGDAPVGSHRPRGPGGSEGTGPRGDTAFIAPVIRDPLLAAALRRLLAQLQAAAVAAPAAAARTAAARDVHAAMAGPPPTGDGAAAMAVDEALADVCAALAGGRHVSRTLPPPADAAVHAVRDRLADELLQPPSLATLAAMAGISRYQLLRRFRAAYGLPPHAWLLQQRAERARTLIGGGTGLAQAAADAGFADQSHMTRVFARHFGYTPGAWLAARR